MPTPGQISYCLSYQFFNRAGTSGRRVCVTTKGNLTPARENAKVGHFVVVLLGRSTPFMLRKTRQEPGSVNKQYRLFGDCYVHGCMDGELVEGAQIDEWEMLALK
ncbi:hypothetical protein HBI56_108820 [Parastagonospora nodorum]|uniref:Uncharacterized protein n=1 Tax=Phaeosphaeria nodorum (strain SN15 / ATCC MYA-4574 / FGSC 10173) TaxID=321614 RepID=A0A7U2EU30_PHANO|nr:hypothetical protein HBH56_041370 [Parastagonospora nodorum]QRC93009.1 hypothetical protein JI435_428780 [Parastagonospora nodorum SN15]KAH3932831.1 hypothetical protein HBH54_069120 [Parastagonospora nodorum]KAH3943427.1 hypothetical protein HBH53_173290 [Parastagonospora nodorum]KAH3961808.1 hypothetical protein HBH52_228470 [Parastagonospora nodorum]